MAAAQVEQRVLPEMASELRHIEIADVDPGQRHTLTPITANQNIEDLLDYCQKHGIEESTLLKSAWALVLSRYLNTGTVVFGFAHGVHSSPKLCQFLVNGETTTLQWLKDMQQTVEIDGIAQPKASEDAPLVNSCIVLRNGSLGAIESFPVRKTACVLET